MFDIPPVLIDNPSCFGISTEKNWRSISCSLGQIFVHSGHPSSPCLFTEPLALSNRTEITGSHFMNTYTTKRDNCISRVYVNKHLNIIFARRLSTHTHTRRLVIYTVARSRTFVNVDLFFYRITHLYLHDVTVLVRYPLGFDGARCSWCLFFLKVQPRPDSDC
ncbi:hypothetical protein CSKR_203318 [Clonorchis sinensis]|uniref:Uncharacterized protein n=1 Tax=Clonorchis sinensis TaxID=79923 RepID=A0A8T1M9K1_CLOSI|nr:hypothetical protein CSKR_203318 [Clonorchis sinensis]